MAVKKYILIIILVLVSFNLYSQNKMTIEIIFLSSVEEDLKLYLKKNLSEIFGADILLDRKEIFLEDAYNLKRRQYLADKILEKFHRKETKTYLLLVIDKDLYTEGLNFIFGQAIPKEKICIISLKRLHQDFYGLRKDNSLFYNRALKEAVHELGHLLGLAHCPDAKCVMHFSNSILDTDKKDFRFCPICKKKINLKI